MSDYTEYYKQAWERSLMKNHTTHHDGCDCVMNKIQELKVENLRLKEALKSISEIYNYKDEPSKWYAGNIAREALKGEE
jgi:hypothetical protein